MKYKIVVSGGTFDHFHKGHREFLQYQFSVSQKVLLGIASDSFVKARKHDGQIQDFEARKRAVEEFVARNNLEDRVEIAPIDTIHIPSEWDTRSIEAIFVTTETEYGALLINEKRTEESLHPLEITVVEHVLAEDGIPISSHRIRNGEINRDGKLYVNPDWKNCVLVLPEAIRQILKKPFGLLLKTEDLKRFSIDPFQTITVGDITTSTFNTLSFRQKISIIDFVVERKKQFKDIKELGFSGKEKTLAVVNPAGTIQPSLFHAVVNALSLENRVIILVEGEEDLSVLVCLLASPLGYSIFYGQPQEGIVHVLVTEEAKERAYDLVSKFDGKEANNTRGY